MSDGVAKQVSMAVEMLYRWIGARDESWFLFYWSGGGHGCVRCTERSFATRILVVLSYSLDNPVAAERGNFQIKGLGANSTEWYVCRL